jgi:uncharacterized membrane protein SpoIIM required for sporulation
VDERTFVAGSRETWERLAASAAEARSAGVAGMGVPALRQMHEDYRQAAADLAYAQTHFPGSETEAYLNGLVAQSHGELYGASPRRLATVWRFIASGYPRLVRKYARPMALSAGLTIGALAVGFLLFYVNYPLARIFLPEMFRDVVVDPSALGQRSADADSVLTALAPVLSAGITANNIQVALMAFAGGMTFGVLTIYALLQNGLLLGVLAASAAKGGFSLQFWSLIVPHGSLELPAIVLSGGAGLVLARALLFPGDAPRMEALRTVGPDAARLILGTVPLFVVAGIVEGFITPRPIDPAIKLGIGLLLGLVLAAYLALAGRGEGEAAAHA